MALAYGSMPLSSAKQHFRHNAIRKLRLLRGLHQRELGARLGATQSQVSAWENGEQVPELGRAMEIALVLGESVERVFFDHYISAGDALAALGTKPGIAEVTKFRDTSRGIAPLA